ncbi:dihydroneopterin aldolase [Corynebacterium sp. 153RC1]|uniref:dihydroneopterin aldolase n=1 Tax=unclassified Corynebacterium TaxID=2624378 RepID=UPI00211BF638|nr:MULTISPECIES: dihydroneopterin aldolase [unclassified Corynebacterium]MCQ9371654.1 dihydroneopterin aldolase [Corynebacterium sp. 35RC1]MCQ9352483.1 dihydroneopterin aldolase [Corynebacterium sp. 209RC1]MCQ9354667.1 dihydroneopterin aldolase [Corynebacterium sp. 1222RC1]MCQ9356778.1 dihydroneopterin aldolase [Corynebacterium sp. 122RC1]MCQ9359018.1 dihydroneopterin aldolase [Corynebacterium sp. 142RC1]
MDRIELRGLRGYGYHGVLPEEKAAGQEFSVDITCWLPLTRTDDLRETVNYAELAELAYGVLTGPGFDLIETVATSIADAALQAFPLMDAIEVTVHKPHAPIPRDFADVAVTARRTR